MIHYRLTRCRIALAVLTSAMLAVATSGQTLIERVCKANDASIVTGLARRTGVHVVGTIDEIGVVKVASNSTRAMGAFESAAQRTPGIRSVYSGYSSGSSLISGPLSVPVINPAGGAQVLPHPAYADLVNFISIAAAAAQITLQPEIVAVIDTGIDYSHPAFQGRIHPLSRSVLNPWAPALDSKDGIDNDGDGMTDPAWGHGTHVSGVIALMCPSAEILALKAIDDEGRGTDFGVAQAIVIACQAGADIINLSLSLTAPSPAVAAALDLAQQDGVIVFTSAGNASSNIPQFPSGYGSVITIGATDPGLPIGAFPFFIFPTETIAAFSNYGFVDYAQIGTDVVSTYPQGQYASWSGTSMATSLATATAALMQAVDPTLDQAGIEAIFTATAIDVMQGSPLGDDALGAGRIDSVAAVLQALGGALPVFP